MMNLMERVRGHLRIVRDTGDWIVADQLLACSYPRRPRLQRVLADHGITTIVNLHTRPHAASYRAAAGHREVHLPVADFTPPSPEQLDQGVGVIRVAIDRGERVAVHCGAGLGRTGTLVACYLVSLGQAPSDAIVEVRRRRPGAIETAAQEAAVHAFAEKTIPPSDVSQGKLGAGAPTGRQSLTRGLGVPRGRRGG